VGLVSTFAINNYVIVLTAYATQIFSSNAALFGWMNSLLGVGAIIGALIASRIKATRIRPIALLALTLCVLQSAVAFVPSAVPFLALLVPIGALGTLFLTASNSLVQRSTPPAMRGRVMGVYSLVLVGGIPLGSPLIGWAVLGLGPVWGFTLGNSVAGASVLTIGVARAVGTRTHPQPGTVDDEASGPPNVRQPVIRTP
jgi:MFS family permease